MLRHGGMLASEAAVAAREYSTHSLRRGALTSLGHANASLAELMDRGRHISARIVLGYVEPTHAGARAMRKLGL